MSSLRYTVKLVPPRHSATGHSHMVVDTRRVVAVYYGAEPDCQAKAFKLNDSGKVK
jgi:hypothetical protein